ncbi:hypothetical protein L6164_028200 [Bauhinia variegata]|uniref:Uncharacterized protein n=1 Tax=Bauhinia variegata TaxID=167791 RepID=A0ACB9LV86_BAUVA|nr:hypothetical protein L6164_028200 [Bauhinia variegata]
MSQTKSPLTCSLSWLTLKRVLTALISRRSEGYWKPSKLDLLSELTEPGKLLFVSVKSIQAHFKIEFSLISCQ